MILLYERIKNKRVKTYERVNDILCKESRHILHPSFFLWKIDPRGRRWSKPGPSLKILSQLTILAPAASKIESRFAIRAMMMTSYAAILNEMYRRTIIGYGILGSLFSATRRLQKYRSSALLPVLIALLLKTEQVLTHDVHRVHRMMRDTRYPYFFIILRCSREPRSWCKMRTVCYLELLSECGEVCMNSTWRDPGAVRGSRAVRLPPPSLQVATVNLHGPLLALHLFRYLSKRASRSSADVTRDAFARI